MSGYYTATPKNIDNRTFTQRMVAVIDGMVVDHFEAGPVGKAMLQGMIDFAIAGTIRRF